MEPIKSNNAVELSVYKSQYDVGAVELAAVYESEVGEGGFPKKAKTLNTNSTISSLGSKYLPTKEEKAEWQKQKAEKEKELEWRQKEFDSWPWWKQALLGIGFGITKLQLMDQIQTLNFWIAQPSVEELVAERNALQAEIQKLIDEFMKGKEGKFDQYKDEFEKGHYTNKTGSSMAKDFWIDALKLVLTKIGPIEMQIQRINNQLRTGLPPETFPNWNRPL